MKLQYDRTLSNPAFRFNLRRYQKGHKKWDTVLFAGITLPEDKFLIPEPFELVGTILNAILLLAGNPDMLGFIYTKNKVNLAVGRCSWTRSTRVVESAWIYLNLST